MDAVEDIKQRLSIEDVVAEYVQLKRSGRNLKGLSPWTSEKTASLMVSPEKQIWHDFSSGRGGDMFSFVMEAEGVDFRTALELLARKSGVDLEKYQKAGQKREPKERLFEASEWAAKFYQTQLKHSKSTLEYVLKQRGFGKETVLKFRLGYSPNGGDALTKFLLGKGFNIEEIKKAGLATSRYRSSGQAVGDMFRSRLMVPLADPQGRVIGFTARLLEDNPDAPKYINTPQTAIYDKSRHAYGLHLAKDSIRKTGFAVVVEGNLDVIASHQAGVENVVATAGTALTAINLRNIARFSHDVRFAFDSDRAGIAATERAIPIAQKTSVSMSIIDIPNGKDPDELVRKDPKLWLAIIDKPTYAVDWLIKRYQTQLDLKTGQGKRQFTDVILKIIAGLEDPVEQDHYVGVLAELLNVAPDAIRSKLSGEAAPAQRLRHTKETPPDDKTIIKQRQTEQHLLSIILFKAELRQNLDKLAQVIMHDDSARALARILKDRPALRVGDKIPPELRALTDYVNILRIQYEELYQGLEASELGFEIEHLQSRLIINFVKDQKAKITRAMQDASGDVLRDLQQKDKRLNQLLKSK